MKELLKMVQNKKMNNLLMDEPGEDFVNIELKISFYPFNRGF